MLYGAVLSPIAAAVAATGTHTQTIQTTQRIPTPGEIYDLAAYPFGLIIAAVFGLTPRLLLSGLQQQVDKYKQALTSTEAPTQRGA